MAALGGKLFAQTEKTITVRMLDGKTGEIIAPSDFLVQVNHEQTVHADWVLQNEDGSGKLTVPEHTSVVLIHASYDDSMQIYANCDAGKNQGPSPDRWYRVSEILASGVVAPDGCGAKKALKKLHVIAKPGEFVFFVRKLSTREQLRN
jgi:hypothetical protein